MGEIASANSDGRLRAGKGGKVNFVVGYTDDTEKLDLNENLRFSMADG